MPLNFFMFATATAELKLSVQTKAVDQNLNSEVLCFTDSNGYQLRYRKYSTDEGVWIF